jgi:signal transduction histidine kinase
MERTRRETYRKPVGKDDRNRNFSDWLSSDAGAGPIGDPIIALMRLLLVSAALLIVYLDRPALALHVSFSDLLLALYVFHSLALFTLATRNSPLVRSIRPWSHWIDIGWCTALTIFSGGANSIFFFIYFFPVLVASLRYGSLSGARAAIASAVSFTMVSYALDPNQARTGLAYLLHRPIYLTGLGLVMAYWGGRETASRRRLTLLKDVNNLSNPRFGVDRTIAAIMERLRGFYDADSCLLITAQQSEDGDKYSLRRIDRQVKEAGSDSRPIDPILARQLLAAPAGCALLYRTSRWWFPWGKSFYSYDPRKEARASEGLEAGKALADLLECRSFVAVPMYHHWELAGQIYLTSAKTNTFAVADIDFILQIVDQVIPVIDNIQVVGQLASYAAEQERERIARNIHDNAIQLYVGLQAGLTSLRQRLESAVAEANEDPARLREAVDGVIGRVDRLIEMTNISTSDLRGHMSGLKDSDEGREVLLSSIQRLAGNFSKVTGISVYVKGDPEVQVNDRLSAEVYQMTVEGLSNIRRHTQSELAIIGVECSGDYLTLQIENDNANKQEFVQFTPRSIAGRAEALGGQWRVDRDVLGRTVLTVEVPL